MAKCSYSGKHRYPSVQVIESEIPKISNRTRDTISYYRCEFCGDYHLTSMTETPGGLDALSVKKGFTFDGAAIFYKQAFMPVKHLIYTFSAQHEKYEKIKLENKEWKEKYSKLESEYYEMRKQIACAIGTSILEN